MDVRRHSQHKHSEGRGLDPTGGTRLERGNTLFVHLNSGKVIEVTPATAVRLTAESLLVLEDGKVVATFPRESIYFATDSMEPVSP